MKITYQGMASTSKYLNVYASMEVGSAVRFVTVKIPIAELDTGVMADASDSKVRQDLLAIWSAERGDDQLFA